MILNLTSMTKEDIEKRTKEFFKQNEHRPVFTDQSDYYSDKLNSAYENMVQSREKINEKMIQQNDKERANEIGTNCFETANKGSKTYLKTRKN